jgi:hypothetical protein
MEAYLNSHRTPNKTGEFAGSGRCALGPKCYVVPFCLSAACSEAPIIDMALHHVIGSFSQATSEDRHIGDTAALFLSNSEVDIEDNCKNCPHLLFISQQEVGLTNRNSTSLCQSTISHSTKVDLFYSVQEINILHIRLLTTINSIRAWRSLNTMTKRSRGI